MSEPRTGADVVRRLPDQAEVDAIRRANGFQKSGTPTPIAKKERTQAKKVKDEKFRERIWFLDKGRCRATGKKLVRSGTTDWDLLGEVDHSIPRSLAPERIYDEGNALLLTKSLNRLRKVACPRAPEFKMFDYSGPDNRRLPQTFVWRDKDGNITRKRIG